MFLAILYSLDGRHVSNRQINASYKCVCVCISACEGWHTNVLETSTFYEVENSTPLMGLEPTITRLHTEFD